MHPATFKKLRLLLLVTSLFYFSTGYCNDLLDQVTDRSKLTSDLKDLYRVFSINHKIDEQKELINLYMDDDSKTELNRKLADYIKVCEGLKQVHFFNDTLNNYVSVFLASTVQSYNVAIKSGFRSAAFKKDYKTYAAQKDKYMSYIGKSYATSRFVDMTEDRYWKLNDKKNYIKAAGYETYKKQRGSNLKQAIATLEKISVQTKDNFQEYAVYQIEAADQYVKHGDKLGDNSAETAIAKYKTLLDKKQYCIYLFEAWLKWRTVLQQNNYGLSKSSDIPNDQYNTVRQQVALTVLNYIAHHSTDKMAINEFLLMATHDDVERFGDYPYGNQNTVEYHEIFDEKK